MSNYYMPLGSSTAANKRANTPNASVLLKYYTEKYDEYAKQGNKPAMKAAQEITEALRLTQTTDSPKNGSTTPSPAAAMTDYQMPKIETVSFDEYYRNAGFNDIESQTYALYDRQIQNAVSSLTGQKAGVEHSADELARQAYISYLQGRENLPQQLSAMGYNGGLSESRQVEMESGWQDRRHQIDMDRQNALRVIDGAISEASSSGQLALAGQLSALRSQAQTQWSGYVRDQEQNALENYWKKAALENDNYWKQTSLDADNHWKEAQLHYSRAQDTLKELARQQELAYQQERDGVSDNRWQAQFDYQQQRDGVSDNRWQTQFNHQKSQDTAKNDWDILLFEYQKRQDEIQNTIKQQQLLLQQLEAAYKQR